MPMSIFKKLIDAIDDASDSVVIFIEESIEKTKCLTGFHQWSSWEYISKDGCQQRRFCRRYRCNKSETRTEHGWSGFAYTIDQSCEQQSQCKRCGEAKQRTEHASWSEWQYQSDGACDESRQCSRCPEEESRLEHIWGSWEFSGPRSCDKVRYCRRCPVGKDTLEATWGDHDLVPDRKINCEAMSLRCQRCGHASLIPHLGEFHDYGPWMRDPDRNGLLRQCSACGETQRQEALTPR